MLLWLESLTVLERVLLYTAIPATLILMIQLVLLLIGLGGGGEADGPDASLDMDGDGVPDGLELDLDGDGIPDGLDLDGDGLPDDVDADGETGEPGIFAGLNIFTVRGVVTFLTLFGWSGLLFSQTGLHPALAVFLGVQAGVIGMVGVALILRSALRLQCDGTLDIRNALGLTGSVYLTIPAGGKGAGKVNVTVQEQLREFEAVTEEEAPIPTGAEVQVIGVVRGGQLSVVSVKKYQK